MVTSRGGFTGDERVGHPNILKLFGEFQENDRLIL